MRTLRSAAFGALLANLALLSGAAHAADFVDSRARSSVQMVERDAASPRIGGRDLLAILRKSAAAQDLRITPEFSYSNSYGLEGLSQTFTTPTGRLGRLDVLASTPATKRQKQVITISLTLTRPRMLSPDEAEMIDAIVRATVSALPAFQIKRIKN